MAERVDLADPAAEDAEAVDPVTEDVELGPVVESLCESAARLNLPGTTRGRMTLPSRTAILEAVETLRTIFFPGFFGTTDMRDESLHYYVGARLDRIVHILEDQVRRGTAFSARHDFETCRHCAQRAHEVTSTLVSRLPEIRRRVELDVEAAYEGDPALMSRDEAIFSYPGLFATTNQRIAHELYLLDVPLIPRMITEHAHSLTGIDIHPGARIGEKFFIDHGTGVVIGETSRIGDRVRIYQGVTLGAKSFPLDERGNPIKGVDRHPVVEDDVVIYAGATILGRVTIGSGATIGGNVWITSHVPKGARITQVQARANSFEHGAGI
ncbi:MAG: serine acetyltransferase [Myxococcales bacterium]|nr:serine acetyltransferase [Myxococcales bacterium]